MQKLQKLISHAKSLRNTQKFIYKQFLAQKLCGLPRNQSKAQEPLYAGCKYSELSVAVKMMSIKFEYNMSHGCFNAMAQLMKETSCPDNKIPFDYYRAKKLVLGLGLTSQKIDCCVNGCMLYYKADKEMTECKFCKEPRYKKRVGKKGNRKIPHKTMHYLPLIPRLQRLYASRRSAEHTRWHYENRREEGVLCHPSDGESWKNFDQTYPDFAVEPRNVRLGLCSDGFTPFSQSASSYSCWPVIVTPYNLPPDICPHNPKKKIDVYLQPLIDELQQLWKDGVVTYDMSKKQNFLMRAALMWTINDFPAYGMLSGWSTAGKIACPICMEQSKTFSLKNGRKVTWFDCNRQFLPLNHEFRRNKKAFYKGREEKSRPPPRLTGDQVWEKVKGYPKITESVPRNFYGYGKSHNCTKKSIFWDLPYWKTNLVRHNLDEMHIEKNVFDNIFHTVMDNSERTKDNDKARLDLKEYCHRDDLHLQQNAEGKWIKPKAKFTLNDEQKKDVCEWVDELKMPDGYASNLGRCVDMKHLKLFGMKSHDCHIFMQCLLPIAFSALPHYTDAIRRNFEKRASARMTQLFQDVRKNLPEKPHWMGDAVFKEMKEHWESPAFKIKSEQNKKNRDSNAGASLHTGGCIPHRVIYKRMKESTGKDPSISEFYFRTHLKKSDKSWVNEKAEIAYNNFERKKQELLACQSASVAEGETNSTGQPSQLTEMDIWVQSVGGKKKGRVKGLGSLGRSVKASKQSALTLSKEIDEMIKAQVNASNANLYAQLREERRKNKRMRKELDLLKKHVYNASSSNEQSSQEDNQAYENESSDDSDSVNDSDSDSRH